RSRKNNVSLFPGLISETVSAVNVLEFERAFTIHFLSGKTVLFKLHGTRSNILYFLQGVELPFEMFRHELKEDASLRIEELRNFINPSWERFAELEGNASQFMPTLGKLPRQWLKQQGYIEATLGNRWKLMTSLLDML